MTRDRDKKKAELIEDLDELKQRVQSLEGVKARYRQVSRELKESRESLSATLNALPDLMFEVDAQGRIYDYRAAQSNLLYMPPDQFMGKTVAQVIPKEATSVIMDAIGQAQRTGRCSGVEYMLEMPSGPYWFELSIAKKGDPKAKHGRMIVIVRDISDRKRAFEELRESNDRFSTVMDSLKAAVYVADMETYELLFVNRCTVDLFGEVLGKPCWASIYDGQSGPCEFCRNAQLVDTAGQPSELCVWEINNPKAGGWWEMRDEAIRWIDGRVVRLTIARNINKRKGSVPPRSDSVPPGLPT